jgi:alanine racemase
MEGAVKPAGARVACVDLGALRANFHLARELAAGREVMPVVKADAYGHGAVDVARCLAAAGCDRLAVLEVAEAATLRDAGISLPLLLLGGLSNANEAALASDLDATPVLHHRECLARVLEAARRRSRPWSVQVEVDTGMNRMGVPEAEAGRFLVEVAAEASLDLEGAFTHFACADDPEPAASLAQLEIFRRVLAQARQRGVRPRCIHAQNSAALMTGRVLAEALPEATAVRPGLMLYGVRPAEHLDPGARLQPVMSVRVRVASVREVPAGSAVGYAASWRPRQTTRIATLPLGYADGVPWALANAGGTVWLAGARRPIVGRVSMDYISVDVGEARVAAGDEATFFGCAAPAGSETAFASGGARAHAPVEQLASAAGTLAYELLVRVGARVPRRLVDSSLGSPAASN